MCLFGSTQFNTVSPVFVHKSMPIDILQVAASFWGVFLFVIFIMFVNQILSPSLQQSPHLQSL